MEDSSEARCNTILDILHSIRQSLKNPPPNNTTSDPTVAISNSIALRMHCREVANEVEARRSLVQLHKDNIEKNRGLLEGLEYYKSMLANKIQVCNIPVQNIAPIVEQQDIEPQDWINQFPKSTQKISQWLGEAKAHKNTLLEVKSKKDEMQDQIRKKLKIYKQQLPKHLDKMAENMKGLMNVFNIPIIHQLYPVCDKRLLNVYNFLVPAKQANIISLEYQDEILELVIQTTQADSYDYRTAANAKLPLQNKTIKLNILNIKENLTVMSLDRGCDFTPEQLFHRLINNEPLNPMFPKPQNEEQRNHNTRYIKMKWLDAIANGDSNMSLSVDSMIKALRDRVFTMQINRLIFDQVKNNKNAFYFKLLKEHETANPHLKKLNFTNLTKLTIEQVRNSSLFIPQWLKLISQSDAVVAEPRTKSIVECKQQYLLQETNQDRVSEYFKITLTYHHLLVMVLFIVPFAYPQKKSTVKILEYGERKKQNKTTFAAPGNVKLALPKRQQIVSAHNYLKMERLDEQLNSMLDELVPSENRNFYLLYQMNRLITLIDEMHTKEINSECRITKLYDV